MLYGHCPPLTLQEEHHCLHFTEKEAKAQSGEARWCWEPHSRACSGDCWLPCFHCSGLLCHFPSVPLLVSVEVKDCPGSWTLFGGALRRSLQPAI